MNPSSKYTVNAEGRQAAKWETKSAIYTTTKELKYVTSKYEKGKDTVQ